MEDLIKIKCDQLINELRTRKAKIQLSESQCDAIEIEIESCKREMTDKQV